MSSYANEKLPKRLCPIKMWYYEVQPGDGTKYEMLIGWGAGEIDFPRSGDEYNLVILKGYGWYMFHKDEFNTIHDGNIEYFCEKMGCSKPTAKAVMTFIRGLKAEEVKSLLRRADGQLMDLI